MAADLLARLAMQKGAGKRMADAGAIAPLLELLELEHKPGVRAMLKADVALCASTLQETLTCPRLFRTPAGVLRAAMCCACRCGGVACLCTCGRMHCARLCPCEAPSKRRHSSVRHSEAHTVLKVNAQHCRNQGNYATLACYTLHFRAQAAEGVVRASWCMEASLVRTP